MAVGRQWEGEDHAAFESSAARAGDVVVRDLLRRLGIGQRFRPVFAWEVSSLWASNCVSRRRSRLAGCAGPTAHGDASRSLRWARSLHGGIPGLRRPGFLVAVGVEFSRAARGGVLSGSGRIVVRRRRQLRFALDAGCPPRRGARGLRSGQHRTISDRDVGAAGGVAHGMAVRVSRRRAGAGRLGAGLWRLFAKRQTSRAAQGARRDADHPQARAARVGAVALLLLDLRGVRCVRDLSTHPAS